MTTWIISGWVHLVVGFIIGWVVFKRPAWVENLIAKAVAWVKRRLGLSS